MNALESFIDRHFRETFPDVTAAGARASVLETDATSYGKLLKGTLRLTNSRAARWALALYPADTDKQTLFIKGALEAAEPQPGASVRKFCDQIVENGGSVPVERIPELFTALLADDVQKPLICTDYRDLPRAAKGAKYEVLGVELAWAVANGLAYAMFQPFLAGKDETAGASTVKADQTRLPRPSRVMQSYMNEMQLKCRRAYLTFRKLAMAEAPSDQVQIDRRFALYERHRDLPPYTGSGFQAKLFFVQYRTAKPRTVIHHRILQWVATPKQDLLIYRGEAEVDPEVVRDCFYPIPHYFDREGEEGGALPRLIPDTPGNRSIEEQVYTEVRDEYPYKDELPWNYRVWEMFADGK